MSCYIIVIELSPFLLKFMSGYIHRYGKKRWQMLPWVVDALTLQFQLCLSCQKKKKKAMETGGKNSLIVEKREGEASSINPPTQQIMREADINGTVDEQGGDQSNEVEKNKVCLVRAVVENQDPSCKEVDDLTIRRFLRARSLDVEKASDMLLKCLKWRRMFVPSGHISSSEVPNEIAQNKMFVQGIDKKGRPIAVLIGARHFQNEIGGLDEFKRFVVFTLDRLGSRMPPGQEKFLVIADLQGWGYCNSDLRAYVGALSILQDYYPERLGKLLIIHVPYIFRAVWKALYPFIDKNTKKKIILVKDKRLKATLLEDIDESQLPETYGGKLRLLPIHEDARPTT